MLSTVWNEEGFKSKKLTLKEHNKPIKRSDCLEQNCVPKASKFIISLCKKYTEVQWEQKPWQKEPWHSFQSTPCHWIAILATSADNDLLCGGLMTFYAETYTPLACSEKPRILLLAEKNVSIMSHSSHFSSLVNTKHHKKLFITPLCLEKTNHIIVKSRKEFIISLNYIPLAYNRNVWTWDFITLIRIGSMILKFFTFYF